MVNQASTLPFVSPLAGAARLDREQVSLVDVSGRGVLDCRGRDVDRVLRGVFDAVPETVGAVTRVTAGILARLRADLVVLVAADASTSVYEIGQRLGKPVTDVTHGYGILHLSGARAPDVLSRLCALDFARFPNLHAAQTSLAKVTALVIRVDEGSTPAYRLLVDRSLAGYVWEVVSDTL